MARRLLRDEGEEARCLPFQLVRLLLDIIVVLFKLFSMRRKVVLNFCNLGFCQSVVAPSTVRCHNIPLQVSNTNAPPTQR